MNVVWRDDPAPGNGGGSLRDVVGDAVEKATRRRAEIDADPPVLHRAAEVLNAHQPELGGAFCSCDDNVIFILVHDVARHQAEQLAAAGLLAT